MTTVGAAHAGSLSFLSTLEPERALDRPPWTAAHHHAPRPPRPPRQTAWLRHRERRAAAPLLPAGQHPGWSKRQVQTGRRGRRAATASSRRRQTRAMSRRAQAGQTRYAPMPTRAHTRTHTHTHTHTYAPLRDMAADGVQQLKALKSDFDGLRSHLTCKICDRMLYQPYTIACGHTYCYTVRRRARIISAHGTQQADHAQCLCTWFLNLKQNKSKLACPDCRLDVKHLPAPAYVVRQAHPVPCNAL